MFSPSKANHFKLENSMGRILNEFNDSKENKSLRKSFEGIKSVKSNNVIQPSMLKKDDCIDNSK